MTSGDRIAITGIGAVSSAGWGVTPLMKLLYDERDAPSEYRRRHSKSITTQVRPVPKPGERLPFSRENRLRRASAITRYAVAAALEALSMDVPIRDDSRRLGLVFVSMNGCVNYSNRFYGEVMADPTLASPILFPETVFNAPASHLAAVLGQTGACYTLIGDSSQFLSGLELGIRWLQHDYADACLIVGAEELDWLSSEAAQLFGRDLIISEGAGALLLERNADSGVWVDQISSQYSLRKNYSVLQAVNGMRQELGQETPHSCLIDSRDTRSRLERAEKSVWKDWQGERLSPLRSLGHSMGASLALQCVIAAALLRNGPHSEAWISHVGTSQQAIGARFIAGTTQ